MEIASVRRYRRIVLGSALMLAAACVLPARAAEPFRAQPMGIGLGGVSGYTSAWTFVDMMKHSREWRTPKDHQIVEDKLGWPVSLKDKDGKTVAIAPDKPVRMYMYSRRIAGDIVLTWEGDGEVSVERRPMKLVKDEYPARNRRVYHWDDVAGTVFDVVVTRSNPKDHVKNIRMWMPGMENAESPFHPLFKKRLEPFSYFRFMDWGRTNNSTQKEWSDRVLPEQMRQTGGVAWEYMIQLANEMDKDMWICVPHLASDDYVKKLAELLQARLEPERLIYVEYSNEIWNGSFKQTRWLWDQAREEGHTKTPWEYGAVLCGKRSAEIWAIMDKVIEPDRLVRTITHFRWLDKVMDAAMDPKNGSGRVDLVALNGYFISQAPLQYTLRSLDNFDIEVAIDAFIQMHLLGKATAWAREIENVKGRWKLPVTVYEGGQHFANPFSSNLQGKELVKRMFEVNAHPRIKEIYAVALESWHLAGGDGFTPFVDCSSWNKYGCWGHLQYQEQPLEDKVDPKTGEVLEAGAHKYAALLDYIARRTGQKPGAAPIISAAELPEALPGKPYSTRLNAAGGKAPYTWSVMGGRLPKGLALKPDGTIVGTPEKAEQLLSLVDCTDAEGRHAASVIGLFMAPTAGAKGQVVNLKARGADGLPRGWKFLGKGSATDAPKQPFRAPSGGPLVRFAGIPYLPASAQPPGYTVEMRFAMSGNPNEHMRTGFAFCLTSDGDAQDHLRVAVDGLGQRVQVYSRYVAGSRNELWRPRECPLVPDKGESGKQPAIDPGEFWTIRATVRPASSPGAIDIMVGVFDEKGASRLDPTGRNDIANGMWLQREIALKDALISGPFGLMATNALVDRVAWAPLPAK